MAVRSGPSAAILAISLELLAVGVFTLLAGSSEEAATVVLIFMVGLWLIFLITESGAISKLVSSLDKLTTNPTNQ